MTTIAWDGEYLVADRMCTSGNTVRAVAKVFRVDCNVGMKPAEFLNVELFAWSGEYQDVSAILHWLRYGEGKPRPSVKEGSGNGLLILKNGQCEVIEDKLFPNTVQEKFYACGSGRDFALGAMAKGASAMEAVDIAARFDCYTGCGTDVLRLGGALR